MIFKEIANMEGVGVICHYFFVIFYEADHIERTERLTNNWKTIVTRG